MIKKTIAEYVDAMIAVNVGTIWAKPEEALLGENDDGSEYLHRAPSETGIIVTWSCKEIGFGELTFTFREGKCVCDSEMMSKDFVEAVLIKLARSCKLNEEP